MDTYTTSIDVDSACDSLKAWFINDESYQMSHSSWSFPNLLERINVNDHLEVIELKHLPILKLFYPTLKNWESLLLNKFLLFLRFQESFPKAAKFGQFCLLERKSFTDPRLRWIVKGMSFDEVEKVFDSSVDSRGVFSGTADSDFLVFLI